MDSSTLERLRAELAIREHGDSGWSRRRDRVRSWHAAQGLAEDGLEDRSGIDGDAEGAPAAREEEPDGIDRPTIPGPVERLPTGWMRSGTGDHASLAIDDAIGGGLVVHGIHEWLGDAMPGPDPRIEASVRSRREPIREAWRPVLGPVCSFLHGLQAVRRSQGRPGPAVAWIGRRCRPTIWSLCADRWSNGTEACAGTDLAVSSLMIVPPDDSATDRRWAVERAIRCHGVDVAVVDARGFTLLDTRRLQVAMGVRRDTGGSAVSVMLLRPPSDRGIRSSATTRWIVHPACSDSPGHASVSLVRVRMPQAVGMEAIDVGSPLLATSDSPWEDDSTSRPDAPVESRDPQVHLEMPQADSPPRDGGHVIHVPCLAQRPEGAPFGSAATSHAIRDDSLPDLRLGPGSSPPPSASEATRGGVAAGFRDIPGRPDGDPDARPQARLSDEHASGSRIPDQVEDPPDGCPPDGPVGMLFPEIGIPPRRRRITSGDRLRGATRPSSGGGSLFDRE
ncbi:MAG: hypothetical protein GY895_14130 [Phycisphaera sp.]|nr:hypothetical protein [Phycisphaera sp.]